MSVRTSNELKQQKIDYIKERFPALMEIDPRFDFAAVHKIKLIIQDSHFTTNKFKTVSEISIVNLILQAQGKSWRRNLNRRNNERNP